jgi:hypothetical protein
MNIRANGMINRRGVTNDNLTGGLQGYVVLECERVIRSLISNANNVALQLITREHNLGFHRRTGQTERTRTTGITSPGQNRMFGGGGINIVNMMVLKLCISV